MPLLLFIVIPIIELALLIKVGGVIGVGWTVVLIVLTAIIGVRLLKQQGVSTLMRAQERMAQGQLPAQELAEGFLLALSGALLLTPGFLTDVFGFSLLVPMLRQRMVGQVLKVMQSSIKVNGAGFDTEQPFGRQPPFRDSNPDGEIIEGEWREHSEHELDQKNH